MFLRFGTQHFRCSLGSPRERMCLLSRAQGKYIEYFWWKGINDGLPEKQNVGINTFCPLLKELYLTTVYDVVNTGKKEISFWVWGNASYRIAVVGICCSCFAKSGSKIPLAIFSLQASVLLQYSHSTMYCLFVCNGSMSGDIPHNHFQRVDNQGGTLTISQHMSLQSNNVDIPGS